MNRTQKVSSGIVWGTIDWILRTVIPFITRTIIIYTIGIQYVGLGSLFTSLLQVLSFAELGIGSALVFSMYEPVAQNDDKKICALLGFYRNCYRVIGLVILTFGLGMLPFLDHLVAGEVPDGINLHLLFSAYLFNTVIGYFMFAYRSSVFVASQRVDVTKRISMWTELFKGILQIVVLLIYRNYYLFVVVIPVSTMANNLLIAYLSKKQYPQYACKGHIDHTEIIGIRKRVGGLVFQKIGNIVLSSVDTIVISAFLGLKLLGIYNGYYYIITALAGIFGTIQTSLIPSVGNSIIKESQEKNYKNFKVFHFLYMWLTIWCCVCLLNLYQPFICLWQGEDNMLPNNIVLLFVIYFFVFRMGDISFIYKEAIGLWWPAKFVPLISAIINLILNIAMVQVIGLSGILLSTIISLVIVTVPFGSKVLFQHYFHSMKYWHEYLISLGIYFLKGIVTAGVTWLICCLLPDRGVIAIVERFLVCCIVPNVIFIIINLKSNTFKETVSFAKNTVFRFGKKA